MPKLNNSNFHGIYLTSTVGNTGFNIIQIVKHISILIQVASQSPLILGFRVGYAIFLIENVSVG